MSVSYCGWLHRTVAFMDSLKQIVWCRGFCTFFFFPAFHRQKLRHFDTSKPLPMMDGDRTWHTCEVAVRVSRCEPDKRNHQRIHKGNMIQPDSDDGWLERTVLLTVSFEWVSRCCCFFCLLDSVSLFRAFHGPSSNPWYMIGQRHDMTQVQYLPDSGWT